MIANSATFPCSVFYENFGILPYVGAFLPKQLFSAYDLRYSFNQQTNAGRLYCIHFEILQIPKNNGSVNSVCIL